jgi:hypothetical protein
MNLKLNTLIAAFGAAILLAPASYAKTAPACHPGKLLDVQENTELVPTAQIGQARQNRNGKEWTTIATPSARKQTTYVVKLVLDGIIYTARSSCEFWAYKPSSLIVNSEVEACVDSNKLMITRPDGKQYKPTIIRRERDQSAPSRN